MVSTPNGLPGNGQRLFDPDVKPLVPLLPVTELQRLLPAKHASCGLNNLGNTCFMNSVLQCLAHLPAVVDAVMRRRLHGFHGPCPSTQTPGAKCAACLVEHQLREQLSRAGGAAATSPRDIACSLHLFSKTFLRGRQEDSHEFLIAALDAVERDSRRGILRLGGPKAQRTLVEELFCGRLRSQVKCLECGHCSNTYETITSISLDIRERSLANSLAHFTAVEVLDGANKYKCDKCKRLVRAHKSLAIHHEPNCLVVHLKRFDALLMGGKVHQHVSFEQHLSLAPYLSEDALAGAAQHNGTGGSTGSTAPRSAQYVLMGVLVHQGGSIHSGHYYAYVCNGHGHWYEANDCSITRVQLSQVHQAQAYMLFYARTSLKPLEPHPPPEPSPAQAATASGPSQQAPHKFIGPQLPPGLRVGPQPASAAPRPLPARSSKEHEPPAAADHSKVASNGSHWSWTEGTWSRQGSELQHENGDKVNPVLMALAAARPVAAATKPTGSGATTHLTKGMAPRAVLLPAATANGHGAVLKVSPAPSKPAAAKTATAHAVPQAAGLSLPHGKRAHEDAAEDTQGAVRAQAATGLQAAASSQGTMGSGGPPTKRPTNLRAVSDRLGQELRSCPEYMAGICAAITELKRQGMSLDDLLSESSAALRSRVVVGAGLHVHDGSSAAVRSAVAAVKTILESRPY